MKLKLAHKLLIAMGGSLLVATAAVTIVTTWKSSDVITATAKTDLEHLAANAVEMCKMQYEQSTQQVKYNFEVARTLFRDYTNDAVRMDGDQLVIGGGRNSRALNGDSVFVDKVKSQTGATCTIFMREGDKAKRIATNVRKEDGSRAVGTYLSDQVYEKVVTRGETYHGRAFVVTSWFVTAYEPLRDANNKVIGVLYVGVPERTPQLRTAMLSQKIGETGYLYAINSEGVLQIHPAKEGADLSKFDFIKEMMTNGPKLRDGEIAWISYPWINKELGETEPREKIVAYTYFAEWDWIIGVGSYLDEFTAPVVGMRNTSILIGVLALLCGLTLAVIFARSITKPIYLLVGAAKSMAQGDCNAQVTITSKDEIGELQQSVHDAVVYMKTVSEAAQRIAANDLTVRVEPRSPNDVLGNSFKTMIHNLSGMIRQLSDNARELVTAATEIASSSEAMANGAKKQSSQVHQVSAAVEEMSVTIVESSRNAGDAATTAKGAASTADSGGQIVSDTIHGMQKIADVVRESAESIAKLAKSADQIGEIISVIDDIADQTNLLALNAAIEAARAGEQGRGFAVVADEVRKLAERTGKATGEIASMIKGIQQQTEDAVQTMETGVQQVDRGKQLADKAGSSLNEIVTMAQRVTEMVGQIATATEQQSSAADEISKNIEQISVVTKETANGAEESAAAAEELNRQAEGLQQMVAKFQL
ncbi:MAG: Cache 3/Cache 2 fusion domain-containing protein [bacterium]|nr:Cache 3/Cache 2 fusion domain-containing protein [bacterium]